MARERQERPGPAEGHAYGAASVTNVLQGAEFPCSKRDLIDEFGDRQIFWTKEHPERLRDILEKIPQDQFNSMADVVHGVGQISKEQKEQMRTRR